MAVGGKVQCVSGSYQNYQNGAVSNQLADGEGVNVLGVNVNLLMSRRGYTVTLLCTSHRLIMSLQRSATT
jgi:hypothetical protein